MTRERTELVDQTPNFASGTAKTPGDTQPACGLTGPRRVLPVRLFR